MQKIPGNKPKGNSPTPLSTGESDRATNCQRASPSPPAPQKEKNQSKGTANKPKTKAQTFRPIAEIAAFIARYIVLPQETLIVIGAWVAAAWLADLWDRFPHLAVTSPEKRCGKSRLLELLAMVTPCAYPTANISPAAVYRLIEKVRPTLLFDEAQSMNRRGSESSEVVRELLNASIDRKAQVYRCGGANRDEIESFSVYSPKIIALIGKLDGVLADRCLPVELMRKTKKDVVEPFRSRIVEPLGSALQKKLEKWTQANQKRIAAVYLKLEPFPIESDRMAELLVPLMAVAAVEDPDGIDEIDGIDGFSGGSAKQGRLFGILQKYAVSLDERDKEQEMQSLEVRLLAACREIYGKKHDFLSSLTLIRRLVERKEEPWAELNRGRPITPEALANLLRPFKINSSRDKKQTARGYYAHSFKDAWQRYLPNPSKIPSNPSSSSSKTKAADAVSAGRKRQLPSGQSRRSSKKGDQR